VGRIKESSRGDEFEYDVFDVEKNFVNATVYLHPAQ
jgi:hypothetical protein